MGIRILEGTFITTDQRKFSRTGTALTEYRLSGLIALETATKRFDLSDPCADYTIVSVHLHGEGWDLKR